MLDKGTSHWFTAGRLKHSTQRQQEPSLNLSIIQITYYTPKADKPRFGSKDGCPSPEGKSGREKSLKEIKMVLVKSRTCHVKLSSLGKIVIECFEFDTAHMTVIANHHIIHITVSIGHKLE